MKKLLAIAALVLAATACRAQTIALARMTTYGVDLSWQDGAGSDPTAGYNVYREQQGDPQFQRINSVEIVPATWTDAQVSNGTLYSYYVTALDSQSNESGPSNTFTISIPWVPFPVAVGTLGAT